MAKVKDMLDKRDGVKILHDDDGGVYLYVNGVLPGTVVSRKRFLKAVAKELSVAIYEVGYEERVANEAALDAPVNVYLFEQSDVGYHKAS